MPPHVATPVRDGHVQPLLPQERAQPNGDRLPPCRPALHVRQGQVPELLHQRLQQDAPQAEEGSQGGRPPRQGHPVLISPAPCSFTADLPDSFAILYKLDACIVAKQRFVPSICCLLPMIKSCACFSMDVNTRPPADFRILINL